MNSSQLFGITTIAYLLSSVFYIGLLVFRQRKAGQIGLALAVLGILLQTAGLGLRWQESYKMGIGHAPLTNMYESLLFFAWCAAIFYVLLELKFKQAVVGAFVMPLPFITMAYSPFAKGQEISPLIPALQSNWLIVHVITCFIGYGAFAVAAGLGKLYLFKLFSRIYSFFVNKLILYIATACLGIGAVYIVYRYDFSRLYLIGTISVPVVVFFLLQFFVLRKEEIFLVFFNALPELRVLDDLIHKTIIFGFMWLSAGIITGAVWANEAWGTYWSWDPKETWSIITWFVYAFTLHARFTRGWSGTRIAWLAVLGFLSVVVTYFGVNFFLSGLHSYGSN